MRPRGYGRVKHHSHEAQGIWEINTVHMRPRAVTCKWTGLGIPHFYDLTVWSFTGMS